MDYIALLISLIIGCFIGAVVIYFILRTKSIPREQLDSLNSQYQDLHLEFKLKESKLSEISQSLQAEREQNTRQQSEINQYNQRIAELNADRRMLNEKLENQFSDMKKMYDLNKVEFENIANKLLEEKSKKFTDTNKTTIEDLLKPFKEDVKIFREKVDQETKERFSLGNEVKKLVEQTNMVSKEANNLTKALKGDNKKQGNWGELILEKVLEKSGLEKGREYTKQESHTTMDGERLIPDFVIHLPDGKKMIVDSKVTLTAYERYVNEEENDDLKEEYLKEHLSSIKNHVEQLSTKNYHDLYQMESPDFVLLFIPIETAFAVATEVESSIYNRAYEKNIIIVTPSTLLATLRTIDSMWTHQKQRENAIEIARQAGALYDKFEGFIADLISIGNRLNATKSDYEDAMNKLSTGNGNLISRVQRLKELGAKAKKSLPSNIINRAISDHQTPIDNDFISENDL